MLMNQRNRNRTPFPKLIPFSDNQNGCTEMQYILYSSYCLDNNVTELLLSSADNQAETGNTQSSNRIKIAMINTSATGNLFVNTVMMGELPLSVASLTFNENTVNILIDHGADMHAQNSYGDTVLHSLVKYSAVYPNKTDNVITEMQHILYSSYCLMGELHQ
jgi:hypothetical protein